jgi:uncharacterized membrane protein YcaP (DUF421 family)
MDGQVFFDGPVPLLRMLVVGVLAYVGQIVLLRLSGKRTLSKMTAFDLVITVAFGSTLATVLLSSSVSLTEGLLALALLAGLQFVVAWASVRARVTRKEVLQAMRNSGVVSVDDVAAVVLETDGSLNVRRSAQGRSAQGRSALQDVA